MRYTRDDDCTSCIYRHTLSHEAVIPYASVFSWGNKHSEMSIGCTVDCKVMVCVNSSFPLWSLFPRVYLSLTIWLTTTICQFIFKYVFSPIKTLQQWKYIICISCLFHINIQASPFFLHWLDCNCDLKVCKHLKETDITVKSWKLVWKPGQTKKKHNDKIVMKTCKVVIEE